MNKKIAYKILKALEKKYPDARIILNFNNIFQLLVAVMLSAQTTDLQVNKVTAKLFPKYKGRSKRAEIENYANADLKELEKDINQLGLYKTKAKNIKTMSQLLIKKHKSLVPNTMENLVALPGVGRKTANVVLGNAFGISEGIAVDTHVKRLSIKYGLSKQKTAEKIEKDLMEIFDKKDWYRLTYVLIEHGRTIRKSKKDFLDYFFEKENS